MKKFQFTYTVKQIDIEHGDILVEFLPADTKLTKYVFNVGTYVPREDGTLKTIEETIADAAPHYLWQAQEMLLEQHDTIINKTGMIDPNV